MKKDMHLVFLISLIIYAVNAQSESCAGRCFQDSSSPDCPCDDTCLQDSSCCSDYVDLCLTNSTTSCFGRCFNEYGTVPDAECYCDDECSKFGNCCDDFTSSCANISLCENRCFFWYDSSLECQCNDLCPRYGNCCPDYQESCLPGTCNGRCGDRDSSLGCQCDAKCSTEYDCCQDFMDQCTTEGSCGKLCGTDYDGERSCQCNDDCAEFGNCCEDYAVLCQDSYLCNGVCNITKDVCSCLESCEVDNSCCTDYEQSCKGGTSWLDDECASEEEMTCPDGFDLPPVVMFSIDGFRNSYLFRHETPNLWKLASCGVHAPYVLPNYPTTTFTNHYSIVTGLYAESTGIIGNKFYDPELDDEFSYGAPTDDPRWWGGQPIWVTASNQGLKSASYFWVGSDANITRYPDYYKSFDNSVPDEERVYQVLEWLDLPPAERPSMITMYIEKVDSAGHNNGPDGHDTNVAINEADNIVGMLMDGLKARNLDKCVNLVVLADHGMANTSCERVTYVEPYGVDMDVVYWRGGAHGHIGRSDDKNLWDEYDPYGIKDKLQCKRNETHFQTYLKYEYLPKRLHFANNDRIEDVNLLIDDEWLVGGKAGTLTYCNGGSHGYNNEEKQMRALFLSHGPSFKRAFNTSIVVGNIEIYNMLTDMLNLTPAPNNGTWGSLSHLLNNPSDIPVQSQGETAESCLYPSDTNTVSDKLGCPICDNEAQTNQLLDLTSEVVSSYQAHNMLNGKPEIYGADEDQSSNYCILTQRDYVTAYDRNKKMAYFASFVLESKSGDVTLSSCLRPDIRVDSTYSAKCSEYNENTNVDGIFLYHPGLSGQRSDAEITSNVIPVYKPFTIIWEQFFKVLNNWSEMYNGISVLTGPVFDYNYDGRADSMEILQNEADFLGDTLSSPIPTHIFAIVARCRDQTLKENIRQCANRPEKTEILSFVIPNYMEDPCYKNDLETDAWVTRTLLEHVARVRDVELLTGMSFFSNWVDSNSDQNTRVLGVQNKVELPDFASDWMQDFIQNVDTTSSASKLHSMSSLWAVMCAILISSTQKLFM